MAKLTKVSGVKYTGTMQLKAVQTARRVPVVKAVPCPDCRAELGQVCRTAAGGTKSTPCRSRRRIATRQLMMA